MNKLLTTLYFPETVVEPRVISALLAFFEPLVHYLPAEAADQTATDSLPAGNNNEKALFYGYPPAPLGKDLERFNKTQKDIKVNLEDYGSRLPLLSISSLPSGQPLDREELSTSSLVAALSKDNGDNNKDAGVNKENLLQERLWQARMVLKLAETLEQEENEINRRQQQIESLEYNLYKTLQGSEENYACRAGIHLSFGPGIVAQRVRAWAQLYLADQDSRRPLLLSTGSPDAADFLFETYEKHFKKEPLLLFSITLPDLLALSAGDISGADFREQRLIFRTSVEKPLTSMTDIINDIATGKLISQDLDSILPVLKQAATDWDETVANSPRASDQAVIKLSIHCFPDISPADLFLRTFNLVKPDLNGSPLSPHTLLAIISDPA